MLKRGHESTWTFPLPFFFLIATDFADDDALTVFAQFCSDKLRKVHLVECQVTDKGLKKVRAAYDADVQPCRSCSLSGINCTSYHWDAGRRSPRTRSPMTR